MAAMFLLVVLAGSEVEPERCKAHERWTVVAHGGAGAWAGSDEVRAKSTAALRAALERGGAVLAAGGTSVDAVVEVVAALEDAPELNAGRGGRPNANGFVELDAAIMRGRDRAAGAVAAVRDVKNPIRLAELVLLRSPHVFLVDRGASAFAKKMGLRPVPPAYFLVPGKREKKSKSGTVGAVALDRCGNVAAATSTGGYGEKAPGRVGDVPIIGAGTYADEVVALSATGWGEWFIRQVAAHDVAARMTYGGEPLTVAMRATLRAIERPAGATGGFIGITPAGEWGAEHTSPGLLRGVATHNAPAPKVGIFGQLR